eukprot:COSAG05_NODE_9796_length_600_cov_203.792415_1_plen_89_part_00
MESEVRHHKQRVKDAEKLEAEVRQQQQKLEKELIDLKRKRVETQVALGNYQTSLQKMYVLLVLHGAQCSPLDVQYKFIRSKLVHRYAL